MLDTPQKMNPFEVGKTFFLDLLFPYECIVCTKEGAYLCPSCEPALEGSAYPRCPNCSAKIPDGKICNLCRRKMSMLLRHFFAPLSYQHPLVQELIQRAKYEPYAKHLLDPCIHLLLGFLAHNKFQNLIDLYRYEKRTCVILVPIPLTSSKLRERGFNQAEYIAVSLAALYRIPLERHILERKKIKKAQVECANIEERKKNIKGVFQCRNLDILNGTICILVDDVLTSGATMNECAKLLRAAGAKEIWGITLAR